MFAIGKKLDMQRTGDQAVKPLLLTIILCATGCATASPIPYSYGTRDYRAAMILLVCHDKFPDGGMEMAHCVAEKMDSCNGGKP